MEYRPRNWMEIIYHNVSTEIYDKREVKLGRMFFDKGGEAMLGALRKEQCLLPDCNFDGYDSQGRKGTLVFIPD